MNLAITIGLMGVWAGIIAVQIRATKYFTWRHELINKVVILSDTDIRAHRFDDWEWRYTILKQMPYLAPIIMFWRSYESWIPERLRIEVFGA